MTDKKIYEFSLDPLLLEYLNSIKVSEETLKIFNMITGMAESLYYGGDVESVMDSVMVVLSTDPNEQEILERSIDLLTVDMCNTIDFQHYTTSLSVPSVFLGSSAFVPCELRRLN